MKFLIDFKNDATQEQIDQYFSGAGVTVVATYSAFDKTYRVEAASAPAVTDIVEFVVDDEAAPIQLQSMRTVEFATADDANWWKLPTLMKPDFAAPTQSINRHGGFSTVYVVDSGVDLTHPEFVVNTPVNLFSFNGDFTDYNGHGTAISSIISGETCGVTDAKIKSVKIFQSGSPTLQSDLLAAFDSIINDVMTSNRSFNIVNLSWVIPKNLFIESKIRTLRAAGVAVIASAGNNGVSIEDVTPASMPEVWTVGAYGQDLKPCNFSNYTSDLANTAGETNSGELDSWAPGEGIRAALPGGVFGNVSGTSFSAAIHSAAVAYTSTKIAFGDGSNVDFLLSADDLLWKAGSSRISNILILEGKYLSSVRNISSIAGFVGDYALSDYLLPSNINIRTYSGRSILKHAFAILNDSAVHFADPLPNGLVLDNGWIRGAINIAVPLKWSTTITIKDSAGVVIKTLPMQVYILPEQFDISTLPQDDPFVQVTLNPSCSPTLGFGGLYYCDGTCQPHAQSGDPGTCYDCGGNPGSVKDPNELQCMCDYTGFFNAC